jgi:hypothetical protein
MSKPPERNRVATLPYRFVLEASTLMKAQRGVWTRTTRKLVGAFIVLALVDLNSSHVRDVVRGLVASWQASQTEMKMGAIAAALDAEYASAGRYPSADQFHEFVRTWVAGQDGDPARDYWGSLITFSPEGPYYELHSCGTDTVCGSEDDIRRRGGLLTRG